MSSKQFGLSRMTITLDDDDNDIEILDDSVAELTEAVVKVMSLLLRSPTMPERVGNNRARRH